ncbi:succinylglutamate desuccinylase/aspartoacylase family protein [uncultured Polaribacter sp.]|mgnify:CR=1 FL=1|uniref:succinylglutamate desuccinylase/aspartoacylase family protein n=1 Tax=uncultured Polaribacter sp. TaxID=174711 RepID=UPI0030DD31DA|tara:strand:+ start:15084 stop:16061 length:978 start_codon:yes stop_codon:yes gene_type:complete
MIIDKKHSEDLEILGERIKLGESRKLNFNNARLFTGTAVEVPVFIERSINPGPTVLITAGIHGDEVNGIEIVREILTHKLNKPTRGTVICMPIVNIFGFINKSRFFPDGRDLNRQFPGNSKGSLASRFAYNFTKEILPLADFCMDFHTGGADRYNAAQIRIEHGNETVSQLAAVFNAPFTLYGDQIDGSYRELCYKMNIPILLNESGKSLSFDKSICKEALSGVKRVLAHLEMLSPKIEVPKVVEKSILIHETTWIRADFSGFLHVKTNLHDFVTKDQLIARISDPFGDMRHSVLAKNSGYIININQAPMVYQGDAIFHISTRTE